MKQFYCLAIVGAGPSCTYVLERLAAHLRATALPTRLQIDIYEKSGYFGSGEVHSSSQPFTSFLNRITSQVSFAADESCLEAGSWLLPKTSRPTLYEWCRDVFARTGDPAFDLQPESWPQRRVHGLALEAMFENFVELLLANPRVTLHRYQARVDDLVRLSDGRYQLVASPTSSASPADHVLFVTGHSRHEQERWPDPKPAGLISYAYPVERTLTPQVVPPSCTVAVHGMGLTALDVILFLTEGRGGTFDTDEDGFLHYRRSGAEPARIIPFSETGLFTYARPFNAKAADVNALEHRGSFLTHAAIDALRHAQGRRRDEGAAQLDFETHIFPLIVAEMALVHYTTLYGAQAGTQIEQLMRPRVSEFILNASPNPDESCTQILGSADLWLVRLEDTVRTALATSRMPDQEDDRAAVKGFLSFLYGSSLPKHPLTDAGLAALLGVNPEWGYDPEPSNHRFSWIQLIDPITSDAKASGETYAAAMRKFMEHDHLRAAQGNLANPVKASCDNVWRDLRPVIAHAVDHGGLTPSSHRDFLRRYMRLHNRLANGAGLEPMRKILALIECGLIDLSTGPGGTVESDEDGFLISGTFTGAKHVAQTLVDAKLHAFDPGRAVEPLYRNLIERGLIRRWCNQSGPEQYHPGGLDLTDRFHPRGIDGTEDSRLTFLGPPTEGVMFFQLGAARPEINHHILQDVIRWTNDFVAILCDATQDGMPDVTDRRKGVA